MVDLDYSTFVSGYDRYYTLVPRNLLPMRLKSPLARGLLDADKTQRDEW